MKGRRGAGEDLGDVEAKVLMMFLPLPSQRCVLGKEGEVEVEVEVARVIKVVSYILS